MSHEQVQTLQFEDDGRIPNNPDLPLLLYTQVLPETNRLEACKSLFERNGWGGMWVNGIFSYHHYHSTAHEVLGIVGGSASVQFGGEQGQTVQVQAGDVVVIPAGVGHCNLQSSADFITVGAYPAGQNWDLCTGKPDERPQVLDNIQRVPLPRLDPMYGSGGPLLDIWAGKA